MYKIMLADDEGIVIDALTFIIEKNFGEKCSIEYAKTGRSVIELAERMRPDIAIMDIQMPGINGIQAMQEIKRFSPGTLFIVLSAYDRFEYAKKAMEIGVLEYINKPIEKSTIVSVLSKAMAEVDKIRDKRSNDLLIREKLETVVPMIENGFIYSVMFQENFADQIDNYKHLLGIEENYGCMLVIRYGEESGTGELTNVVGTSVRVQSCYHEMREIVQEFFHGVIGPMMANMLAIYVPVSEENIGEEYEKRVEMIESARKMVRKLKERLDAKFLVGIGSARPFSEAGTSYSEAIRALRNASGSVSHFMDAPVGCQYEDDYPIETENKMLSCVSAGNVQEAAAQATHFFDWMLDKHSGEDMDIKIKVLDFVLRAEQIAFRNGNMTYRFNSRSDYLETIVGTINYEELRLWFMEKIQNATKYVAEQKDQTSLGVVDSAKEYIRAHYHKDISLDEVSRKVNISPYYFSKLFKEETGVGFVEYVTGIRMEKAKELLRTTNLSMKEICNAVGYADSNYFSRSFKKNVGVTPTEYKENR